ncbi:MAG: hypothetical protein FD129_1199 [bacterium]|nr:MAG: hypothetical protein FD129_1199 [bacterium]
MPLRPRSTRSLLALIVLSLGLIATEAGAATVSHTAVFPLGPYLNGGSHTFPPAAFPRFNLAGECLESVCIRLDGGTLCDIGFENYQLFPVRVTVTALATITLQRPDTSPILMVQPTVVVSDSLPVYDGVLDYAGPSGRSYFSLPGADADSTCLTTTGDLALFAGAGTINLPGFATDGSFQVGASSWAIGPRPYANITVTYHYRNCIVPTAPTTWSRIKGLVH